MQTAELIAEEDGRWFLTAAGAHVVSTPIRWKQVDVDHQRLLDAFTSADQADHGTLVAKFNHEREAPRNSRQIEELMHDLQGWGLVTRPAEWEWKLTEQGRALLASR